MAFSGVRSRWLIELRNSLLARSRARLDLGRAKLGGADLDPPLELVLMAQLLWPRAGR
jgi:hypothetical protein